MTLQIGKDLRLGLLKRGAALVLHQIKRLLGLAVGGQLPPEAPRHLRRAGHAFDKLDGAKARQARPHHLRHVLHDQPQRRIDRRALGLPQEPRRGALPRPRHRAQHFGQLPRGRLRKFLVKLGLIGRQRCGKRRRGRLGREHVGVKPRHMDRIGLHEFQIDRIGQRRAVQLGEFGMALGIHAHVQHRPRPAPFGVRRAGAHRHQLAFAEQRQKPRRIGHLARSNRPDGIARHRHGLRHRQVKPDQPLQALGPPAMPRGFHRRRGRDFGELAEIRMFLHCGDSFCGQNTPVAIRGKRKRWIGEPTRSIWSICLNVHGPRPPHAGGSGADRAGARSRRQGAISRRVWSGRRPTGRWCGYG